MRSLQFHSRLGAESRKEVAARHVPCSCEGCIAKSKLPIEQRYTGPSKACVLWPIFRLNENKGLNDFIILKFSPKKKNEEGAIKRSKDVALISRGSVEAGDVVDRGYGVVTVSEGDNDYDYYPLIWDGTPYEIKENVYYDVVGQEESVMLSKGEFVCEAFWMYKIEGAPQWYTPSDAPAFVRLQHVLAPNLELTPINKKCQLPNNSVPSVKRQEAEMEAVVSMSSNT